MSDRHASSIRWAIAGLAVSLVLIVIKVIGYLLTNSAAVLADALESCVHLATSTFALFAVWLSAQPGDSNHPYGHGKVEYLSAGLEGSLVGFTGVSVIFLGIRRLLVPVDLPAAELGALVELLAAAIAYVSGTAIARAGRRNDSPTIEADGIHIRSDAFTSLGGFAGVGLVAITGQLWFDAAVAILLGFYLIGSGVSVVRRAIGGLMDEARPELNGDILEVLCSIRTPGWLVPHAMKVHRLGQSFHIDLHVAFPRYWDLERAHDETHRFTDALRARFGPRVETMVHAEPCSDAQCYRCEIPDCPIRAAEFEGRVEWTLRAVTDRRPPSAEASA